MLPQRRDQLPLGWTHVLDHRAELARHGGHRLGGSVQVLIGTEPGARAGQLEGSDERVLLHRVVQLAGQPQPFRISGEALGAAPGRGQLAGERGLAHYRHHHDPGHCGHQGDGDRLRGSDPGQQRLRGGEPGRHRYPGQRRPGRQAQAEQRSQEHRPAEPRRARHQRQAQRDRGHYHHRQWRRLWRTLPSDAEHGVQVDADQQCEPGQRRTELGHRHCPAQRISHREREHGQPHQGSGHCGS
jgi:hypothetical protein